MKLGRIAWLALGIGVFVIILATLFTVYSNQSKEQGGLKKSLADVGTQLTKLVSGRTALENQLKEQQDKLDAAQALLTSSKANFPVFPTGIEYDEVLVELAKSNGLDVMSMSAGGPSQKKVGDVTFTVLSFDVVVRGEVGGILGMVSDIAKDKRLVSVTVGAVEISVPEATTEGEEPPPSTATIRLSGYCCEG